MEIAKKIASNTFSQVFARFFNAAISILIVRIITGYLGAKGYGRYTIVYSFIAFFDIAADLGLFTIAVAEMSKARERMGKIFGNILSLRLILVCILGLVGSVVVWFFPSYPTELKIGIVIAAIGMALNHLGITLSAALQVHYKMPLNAIAIAASKVVMIGLIYYISKADLGFVMLIAAGMINNGLVLLITYLFARRYMQIRLQVDFNEWKRLISKSLAYGISLICGAFFIYLSPLVLNAYATEADVGIYGVANKIVQLLIIIPFAFMNAVLPSIGTHLRNKARLNDIIRNSFDFLVTLGLGMVAGTVVLSGSIINLASSSSEFAASALVLQILVFGVFFLFLHNLFSYVLLAAEHQKKLLVINIIAAVTTIAANMILIPLPGPWGGLRGAAIASVLPQFLVLVLTFTTARRVLGFSLVRTTALRALLSAILMGIVLWYTDTRILASLHPIARLAVEAPLGGLLYFILLFMLKGVSPQAREVLFRRPSMQPTPGTADPLQSKTVAIDVRAIAAEKTGKEWYTLNILQALSKVDTRNRYILYTRYRCSEQWFPKNFTVRRIRLPLIFWHPAMMIDMWKNRTDILLATASYIAPSLCFFQKPKPIVVIHDAVAFLFPRRHQLKARIIEKYTVGLALKHAKAVIAVSEHTKQDIVRLFHLNPQKVHVIGEAARDNFRIISDRQKIDLVLAKYGIPDKFILFVGTLEPRKNLATLLKAYAKLPERTTYKLVIVGKKGWYYAEVFRAVKKLNLSDSVIFTGYVPDEDLPVILNAASAFVLPSLYEGFGLPLLEAFACATPVITSDSSALREIASDTCLMVDPLNDDQLRSALHLVLTDQGTRDNIVAAGLARVKEYSWERAASELARVINNV